MKALARNMAGISWSLAVQCCHHPLYSILNTLLTTLGATKEKDWDILLAAAWVSLALSSWQWAQWRGMLVDWKLGGLLVAL